jgi:hypothetical protein
MDKESIYFAFSVMVGCGSCILGVLQYFISRNLDNLQKRIEKTECFIDDHAESCEGKRRELKKDIIEYIER